MIHSYYFSASGTTEDIVRSIAGNMGGGDDAVVVHHNLTGMRAETAPEPDRDDVVLFAAPVYGGRLPAMAAERFRRIRGAGQKCVAVVVYGNRDYEDALLFCRKTGLWLWPPVRLWPGTVFFRMWLEGVRTGMILTGWRSLLSG